MAVFDPAEILAKPGSYEKSVELLEQHFDLSRQLGAARCAPAGCIARRMIRLSSMPFSEEESSGLITLKEAD